MPCFLTLHQRIHFGQLNKRNKNRYFYIVWGLRINLARYFEMWSLFLGYKGLEISFDDFEKGNIAYLTTRIARHYKQIQLNIILIDF